jgi:hypothetical protein
MKGNHNFYSPRERSSLTPTPVAQLAAGLGLVISLLGNNIALGLELPPNFVATTPEVDLSPDGTPDGRDGAGSEGVDLPPDGTPGGRDGAGTRGDCNDEARPQALAPDIGSLMGDNLSLYFIIDPYVVEYLAEDPVIFSLKDVATDEELFRKTLTVELEPEQQGAPILWSIDVTTGESPVVLEADQVYRWTVTWDCETTQAMPVPPRISGTVFKQETDPGLMDQIAKATSLVEQLTIYQEAGLTYDQLAVLFQMVANSDAEVETRWRDLLPNIPLDLVRPALMQRL